MTARFLYALLAIVLTAGCASKVPPTIREPIAGSPTLAAVHRAPADHLGAAVRWGGTIVAVENRPDTTRIEVVGRRLGSEGRPESGDATAGRFLTDIPGFLDPALYASGRAITVVGTLAAPETHTIGEYAYRFPVVRARAHYLWPKQEPARERSYPPPWYYDPWYHDPWYPYHRPYHPYW